MSRRSDDRKSRISFQGKQRLSLIPCLLAGVLLCSGLTAYSAETTVTVSPNTSQPTWDGWGVSLCWWANTFGTREDLADLLFTTRTVRVTTHTGTHALPGLGLNIARYNIGGSSSVPAFGLTPNIPETIPEFKQMPGFWRNWGSEDPGSASFHWSADASQRKMLTMARDRGANRLEAFSNAPMWWMCLNRSTAGSDNGGNNLASAHYREFAVYLATVVAEARTRWGVRFDHVSPFNEPSAWWWKYPGGQEGCHFDLDAQQKILSFLRAELDKRGLRDVGISASDENSVDEALKTWTSFSGATRALVARVNVHGYSGQRAYRGPGRRALFEAVSTSGKPLWNSEYGEADGTGQTMARSILLDIQEAGVRGWVYWQPLDSGGWGLIQSNPGDNWIGPPNAKYTVLAHFSRHIRPGMRILPCGDTDTVAAYDPDTRRLVLVTVNGSEGRWVKFDLSGFGSTAGPVTRWTSHTGEGKRYERESLPGVIDHAFRAWCEPRTIQTFEVENVTLLAAP